jgi:hypothetical protein
VIAEKKIRWAVNEWRHSAIFKMATEDFPVLLAPSVSMLPLEVFNRKYLVEYPSKKIWLSAAEAWLLSDGFKFYTYGSLFEDRAGSGVFSEKLDLKASFALGTFATVFQPEVYAILACSDYCLRDCMTGKTICICSDSRATLLALSSHTVWQMVWREWDLNPTSTGRNLVCPSQNH